MFLNLLGDFEDIEVAITAVEKGEIAIAFEDGEEVPLQKILDEEIPPTPDTHYYSSCGSNELKDVTVRPFQKVAHQCQHCQAIFEPNYFVGDLEVEDLE